MFNSINKALLGAHFAVQNWFRRAFKEEKGGAEVIATLIIIAVVLVLALTFREKLSALVKNLWNGMITTDTNASQAVTIPEW